MSERAYASPTAFRTALTDRLKRMAEDGPWTLPQLQRQIAYDRLLERLYLRDAGWIVKGAAALLARDLAVRATIDVDVYRDEALSVAEAELREAASSDLGDWFRFELSPGSSVADGATGVRLPVAAFVGTTKWCEFKIDLVGSELRMTGQPDDVPALARVAIGDIEQHGYRAYPLVDHIADKVAAILQRYGASRMPSTRFKDLVDLVAIVSAASVAAEDQLAALQSEAERRTLTLPPRFAVPDRDLWSPGYAAAARDSLLPGAHTLDSALAVVGPFLDPLLDGTAVGVWDPHAGSWAAPKA